MFGILSITVIYNSGAKGLKGDNFQGGKGYKDRVMILLSSNADGSKNFVH